MIGCLFVAINSYLFQEWVVVILFWYIIPLMLLSLACLSRGEKLNFSVFTRALIGPVIIPVVTLSLLG